MAIITQCPECGKKLKASETQIGKKAKCPQCQKPFTIHDAGKSGGEKAIGSPPVSTKQSAPAPTPTLKRPAPAAVGGVPTPREDWYLQTADGEEYGPVSRAELDEWIAEGRVDAECQLLREGWDQWKWAEEVFPQIKAGEANGSNTAAVEDDNPFAGIGEAPKSDAGAFAGIGAAATNPYVSPGAGDAGAAAATSGGEVTRPMRVAMRQTKPWVLLFLVLACIACLGPVILLVLSLITLTQNIGGGLLMLILSLIYLALLAAVAYFLYKYFDALGRFERAGDTPTLEVALEAQKNLWMFYGIITLVGIVVTIIGPLLMMAVGVGLMAGAAANGGGGF